MVGRVSGRRLAGRTDNSDHADADAGPDCGVAVGWETPGGWCRRIRPGWLGACGDLLPNWPVLDQARSARRGPGAVTGSCGAAAPPAFGGGAESQPARSPRPPRASPTGSVKGTGDESRRPPGPGRQARSSGRFPPRTSHRGPVDDRSGRSCRTESAGLLTGPR